MNMDFHDRKNSSSYTNRQIDTLWLDTIKGLVEVKDKKVLDIGCGGGLYSACFAQLGAKQVIGLDFSAEMVKTAENENMYPDIVSFRQGNALDIPLEEGQADLILERAVIHHIKESDLLTCFSEAHRVLREQGTFVIQDRTVEDCFLHGSHEHIRGYFFEKFPHLKDTELKRRHTSEAVTHALEKAGFKHIHEQHIWEERRKYLSMDQLREDLLARKGRSLLHALSDHELDELVTYIEDQVKDFPLVEKDRWTIWKAEKAV
ncbi:class I SAM-dependent methyltransferase [Bacillus horti]|uniref:SAM-dependent methyltransferase n=1 Tax=Caldalkalibacillus horti TaxID=77523 RepID=A0ABT9W538_9BACI|nr:class I SAM-dependent methyltransferase [Bacillus horti]MDQ0168357.1 SAM-dependent methyltransferase [Bacillus horti]